jgi:colicin import membrane protein
MTAAHFQPAAVFVLSGTDSRRFWIMLGVSLALHVVCVVFLGVRLSASSQTPLASYEVALVSLSQPQPVSQPPAPEPPKENKPPMAQKAPAPKPAPPQSQSRSAAAVREALRGMALPPEAPSLTESLPANTAPRQEPKRLREEIDNLLAKLAVPAPASPAKTVSPPVPAPGKPVVTEDLRRQLQELQRLPAPPAEPAPVAKAATVPAPMLKRPTTNLDVPGIASGSSLYLAQVQNMISSHWQAPNVGDFAQLEGLQVTVRFRLHRSGKVTDVAIESSSGNEYYDLSGKRAVLSADPLPPFPKGMREPYLDAHFRFVLGGQAG